MKQTLHTYGLFENQAENVMAQVTSNLEDPSILDGMMQ
jgi:hypothetical protein